MKKASLLSALTLLLAVTMSVAQGISTPRTASPGATVSQNIGISNVTVNYSRPSVKGRDVWGALVPYGWNVQSFGSQKEAPWRAGANENTVLTLSHDATVQGIKVPAGSYGLFFVINKDNTGEVVVSKDFRSWGSFWYDPAQDVMRARISLREIPHTKTLTYDFINADKTSAELVLNWEKKQFPVKIEFAVDQIVMANAKEELKNTTGFTWQGYSSAANYSLQNKIDMEQGLKWIETAITQNKNFQTMQIKAGLLKETGKTEEHDKLMKEALVIATENELNNYGYQLLGQNNFDKAIEVLALVTTRFPKSANAWDSLGEAYALKGDKDTAIKYFKKSLTLNPPAGTKANSEKYLKQFGAM